MQPVLASSEYSHAASLPKNTRPETTAGCEYISVALGTPNAHLSFRFGTCAAVRPELAAVWNRAFCTPAPQPFHDGPLAGFVMVGLDGHLLVMVFESPATLFIGRPERNSANCRFCRSLKLPA